MSHQDSSSAEVTRKSQNLKLRPIYTLDNNPHKDHYGLAIDLRDGKNRWVYDVFYCVDCEEEYVLKFQLPDKQ